MLRQKTVTPSKIAYCFINFYHIAGSHVVVRAHESSRVQSLCCAPECITSGEDLHASKVSKDLVDAYVEICKRNHRLSIEEGNRIGVEALVLIAQIREELCSKLKYWTTEALLQTR
jgi:hypothetical protein